MSRGLGEGLARSLGNAVKESGATIWSAALFRRFVFCFRQAK